MQCVEEVDLLGYQFEEMGRLFKGRERFPHLQGEECVVEDHVWEGSESGFQYWPGWQYELALK